MFVKGFLVVNMIIVILITYFTQKRHFSYINGKILLTSISINDTYDVDVKNLVEKSKKNFKIISFIFILFYMFMFFLDTDILAFLNIFGIFLYILFTVFYLNNCIKKIRKIKREKGFKVLSKNFVDLKTSVEINKKQFGVFVLIIPILVYIFGSFLIYMFFGKKDLTIIFTNFIILISFLSLGFLFRKVPIKIVSENSDVNIEVNVLKKIKLQEKVFYFSNLLVVLTLIINYFSQIEETLFPIFILISALTSMFLILYIVFLSYKIEKEIFERFEDERFFLTEDDNFDMLGYNNFQDNRILVQSPINPAKFVINRGNKIGKFIFSFTIVSLIVGIFAIGYFVLPSKFDVDFKENNFKISSKMYFDDINFKEIESVKLIDKLPDGRLTKVSGNNMDYQSYGNFRISKIGDIRLYIFNKVSKIIEIKLKDKRPIFINQDTTEKTEKLYEKILEKIK